MINKERKTEGLEMTKKTVKKIVGLEKDAMNSDDP